MGIILIGVIVVYILLFPLWVLLSCAFSNKLDLKAKILWIIVILFLGPFGPIVYAVFGTQSRSLRQWTWGYVTCGIAAISWLLMFSAPIEKKKFARAVRQLEQAALVNLPENSSSEWKAALLTLQSESLSGLPWQRKAEVADELEILFQVFIRDGRLSDKEYHIWNKKYRERSMLVPKELKREVRDWLDGVWNAETYPYAK